MRWSDVIDYVSALRALLRSESVQWDNRRMQLMYATDHLPKLPIEFPVYMAAEGPKGLAAARDHAGLPQAR